MTVAAILRHKGHEVISVSPTTGTSDIARVLTTRRIGAVLVLDSEEQVLGIVTERDVVRVVAGNGNRSQEMVAGQIMRRVVHTVTPDASLADVMQTMTARRIRYLPVLDHGSLSGIVSIGDVVKAAVMRDTARARPAKAYAVGAA